MEADLKQKLDEISGQISALDAKVEALRSQVATVEYGVLTMAQKLLAESEIKELKMRSLRLATA